MVIFVHSDCCGNHNNMFYILIIEHQVIIAFSLNKLSKGGPTSIILLSTGASLHPRVHFEYQQASTIEGGGFCNTPRYLEVLFITAVPTRIAASSSSYLRL